MFFSSEKHPNIYTVRLKLRSPSFLDVNDVFDFCSDPDASKYADWSPHNTKGETRDYIAWLKRKASFQSFTWVIEKTDDQKVIGTISITEMDYSGKIATIGYTLSKVYQHKGYATEAVEGLIKYLFEDLFCERVQAKVMPENSASIRLLERVGMKKDALLKKGAYCKTACVDIYLYSITKKF